MDKNYCAICGEETTFVFAGIAMGKYKFDAVNCPRCGLLQFKDPYWLPEAYSDAIADTDTGLVQRNLYLSQKLVPILFYLFGAGGSYVDFAGGTGLLVRLMRDAGFDHFWNDKYCDNIHARGFEFTKDQAYCAVTAFEVLEHLEEPISFFTEVLKTTRAKVIIFSTECYEGAPPAPEDWWYYSFHSGQHISFYQTRTLRHIAEMLGLAFTTYEGMHFVGDSRLIRKVDKFFSSKWRRKLAKFEAKKQLKSKTWSDHVHLKNMRHCE